jgi:Arm DNA-binding domain
MLGQSIVQEGSKWFTGGVMAAPRGRIQFDFVFKGIRYRPSIRRPPSEANLRRARERLESIKHQIRLETFSFEEAFTDYRLLHRLSGDSKARLCSEVFDAYLAHCEARLQRQDVAAATVSSYRKILDGRWPRAGSSRPGRKSAGRFVGATRLTDMTGARRPTTMPSAC